MFISKIAIWQQQTNSQYSYSVAMFEKVVIESKHLPVTNISFGKIWKARQNTYFGIDIQGSTKKNPEAYRCDGANLQELQDVIRHPGVI